MIVCTCDTCGRVVESWNTLNINLRSDMWQYQICNDCCKNIKNKIDILIDNIIVTNNKGNINE